MPMLLRCIKSSSVVALACFLFVGRRACCVLVRSVLLPRQFSPLQTTVQNSDVIIAVSIRGRMGAGTVGAPTPVSCLRGHVFWYAFANEVHPKRLVVELRAVRGTQSCMGLADGCT